MEEKSKNEKPVGNSDEVKQNESVAGKVKRETTSRTNKKQGKESSINRKTKSGPDWKEDNKNQAMKQRLLTERRQSLDLKPTHKQVPITIGKRLSLGSNMAKRQPNTSKTIWSITGKKKDNITVSKGKPENHPTDKQQTNISSFYPLRTASISTSKQTKK